MIWTISRAAIGLVASLAVLIVEILFDVLSGAADDDLGYDPLDDPFTTGGPGYAEKHEFFWETGTRDEIGHTWHLD